MVSLLNHNFSIVSNPMSQVININLIKKYLSEYYISKAEKLNHDLVFKNGYTYLAYMEKKYNKKYKQKRKIKCLLFYLLKNSSMVMFIDIC